MKKRGSTIWKRKKKEEEEEEEGRRSSRLSGWNVHFLVVLFFYLIKRRHYRDATLWYHREPPFPSFVPLFSHRTLFPLFPREQKGGEKKKKEEEEEEERRARKIIRVSWFLSRWNNTRWSITEEKLLCPLLLYHFPLTVPLDAELHHIVAI